MVSSARDRAIQLLSNEVNEMDFSHIPMSKKQDTAEIAIEGMQGFRPVIICKPANERNPAYLNERNRRLRRGRRSRSADITVDDLNMIRDINIDLIPKFCAVGFVSGTVIDANGSEVPFSEDACRELLTAVRKRAMDSFDAFAADCEAAETFEVLDDPEDVQAQAGNSPT